MLQGKLHSPENSGIQESRVELNGAPLGLVPQCWRLSVSLSPWGHRWCVEQPMGRALNLGGLAPGAEWGAQ